MVDIAEADGNGADLADWATSTRLAYELGEEFSQHLPISNPDNFPPTAHGCYRGPVVAVVNPNTFSCGDLFAAGIADYGIGQIVSVGEGTGAGGANVWTSDDIQYAYYAARRPLSPHPGPGWASPSPCDALPAPGSPRASPSRTSASTATIATT